MLKYKFFIYILLFITFVSCRYRQNVTDKKVSIFYFTGNIDTYRQLECEDIEKFSEKDINARKDSKRKESYKILVYFN